MKNERIDEASAEVARSRARREHPQAMRPDADDDPTGLRGLVSEAEQLRLLVAALDDYAIIALDPVGRVATWNEGARHMKGYEAEEVIGRHFALFYPLEDIERGKAQAELALARETGTFEEEGWRVRKGGERFRARVRLTAVHDDAGNICAFVKITRDLTAREHARAAAASLAKLEARLAVAEAARAEAEAAERRLFGLVGAMSDGYFTLDEQWRFSFVNPALATLLGTPERELVGHSFWDEVTDSVQSNFFKCLPGLLPGGAPVEFTEHHGPTGRLFAVRAQRSADGTIVVFLRDATRAVEPHPAG